MCIFSQLFIVFSIFRTPCVVKYDFKPYIYIFLTQGCQEPPIYLVLTFQVSHSTCKTTQHSKNALQGPPLKHKLLNQVNFNCVKTHLNCSQIILVVENVVKKICKNVKNFVRNYVQKTFQVKNYLGKKFWGKIILES